MVEGLMYFAPMSSPKPKHLTMKNSMDFLKINDGEFGAINFNNMIPVCEGVYTTIDFDYDNVTLNKKYIELLINQLFWLRRNVDIVCNKSRYLYNMYNSKRLPKSIMERCINFKLLEEYSVKYKLGDKSE